MTAPAPTRAEEGRETGQVAYEAWVEGEGLNLVAVSNLPLTPWRSLSDKAKAIWEAIERKSAAQAEALVARLRERVATLEAALGPFATAAETADADCAATFGGDRSHLYENDQSIDPILPSGETPTLCKLGDFRAARTALEAPHADK